MSEGKKFPHLLRGGAKENRGNVVIPKDAVPQQTDIKPESMDYLESGVIGDTGALDPA